MEKRFLGKTSIEAGVVGLGCEGLIGKEDAYFSDALDLMEKAGANAIDLYSPNPQMRSSLGRALAGRREKFILQGHICAVWQNGQYKRTRNLEETRKGFEDQLARLGTDYIDVGMIHYVDALPDWERVCGDGVLDYALSLKKDGKIRAIGLSSHNPEVGLAAVRQGTVQVLMFSINPCYDLQPASEDVEQLWNRKKYEGKLVNMDPERMALYEECARLGIGITVMKAFGGGDLLNAEQSLAGIALTADQCIAYALDRPAVACVFAGAHTLEELKASLAFAEATPAQRDYAAALASFPRISWKGHCMYCGHCAPCSAKIDIAEVTRFLNLALAQGGVPETVQEHYDALAHTASECNECGACEKRCPFDVKIRQNMKKAAGVFGQ